MAACLLVASCSAFTDNSLSRLLSHENFDLFLSLEQKQQEANEMADNKINYRTYSSRRGGWGGFWDGDSDESSDDEDSEEEYGDCPECFEEISHYGGIRHEFPSRHHFGNRDDYYFDALEK